MFFNNLRSFRRVYEMKRGVQMEVGRRFFTDSKWKTVKGLLDDSYLGKLTLPFLLFFGANFLIALTGTENPGIVVYHKYIKPTFYFKPAFYKVMEDPEIELPDKIDLSNEISGIKEYFKDPAQKAKPLLILGSQGVGKSSTMIELVASFKKEGRPAVYLSFKNADKLDTTDNLWAFIAKACGNKNPRKANNPIDEVFLYMSEQAKKGKIPLIVLDDIHSIFSDTMVSGVKEGASNLIGRFHLASLNGYAHVIFVTSEGSLEDKLQRIPGVRRRFDVRYMHESDPDTMKDFILNKLNSHLMPSQASPIDRTFTERLANDFLEVMGCNLSPVTDFYLDRASTPIEFIGKEVHKVRRSLQSSLMYNKKYEDYLESICMNGYRDYKIEAEESDTYRDVTKDLTQASIVKKMGSNIIWYTNVNKSAYELLSPQFEKCADYISLADGSVIRLSDSQRRKSSRENHGHKDTMKK